MNEEVLIALNDLTNGALNYYQAIETVMVRKQVIENYIKQLQQENQELKKQLEELDKKLFFTKNELDMRQKSINNKLNQQKEFIEYINEKIDICDGFIDTIRSDLEKISYGGRICGKTYIANEIMKNEVAKKILEEILSKYKEIIGGKNDRFKMW